MPLRHIKANHHNPARPGLPGIGSHGAQARMGQAVQAMPPEVRPPQRAADGRGGAKTRGAATAKQAAPAAVSGLGGAAPPPSGARQPPGGLVASAHKPPKAGSGRPAQSRRPKTEWAQPAQSQPPQGVAVLCTAAPEVGLPTAGAPKGRKAWLGGQTGRPAPANLGERP